MPQISKKAALDAGKILDAAADMVTHNAALFGIEKGIAEKFAYQCDLLSDHVARQAGIDPIKMADFDPEEIGQEESGPIEQESDESYMDDAFSQQENRELRERQEAGDMGDEIVPEMQSPQSGVQASVKLASLSQGLHKAAARLTDSGQKQLGAKLASTGNAVLDFQTRLLLKQASAEQAETLVTAGGHILPHIQGDVPPASVEKLARMADIVAGLTR